MFQDQNREFEKLLCP